MKPPPFDYLAPSSVQQVVDLLSTTDREVKVLAGGQSLMPVLNLRMAHPEVLVDISRVEELGSIKVTADRGLRVGAAVTQARVADDPRVQEGWPLLPAAIAEIGHPQIRNRGTLCGSLAHNDPAAELPSAVVALGATLTVAGPSGVRTVPATDFFLGTFTTALEMDELLVSAEFPPVAAGTGWSFREFALRRGDFAAAGVAVLVTRAGGLVDDIGITLFGVGSGPVAATSAEEALRGSPFSPELAHEAARTCAARLDPTDDIHSSAAFRRELVSELTAAALTEAWERSA